MLDNSEFRYINISEDGHIEAEIHGPSTAFGELLAANNTPVSQADTAYGLSTEKLVPTAMGAQQLCQWGRGLRWRRSSSWYIVNSSVGL